MSKQVTNLEEENRNWKALASDKERWFLRVVHECRDEVQKAEAAKKVVATERDILRQRIISMEERVKEANMSSQPQANEEKIKKSA